MPTGKVLLSSFIAICLAVSHAAAAADRMVVGITQAEIGFDQRTGEPVVSFRMTEVSRQAFAEFTTRNVGQKAEFRLDGRTVMAPIIRSPITGGAGQISNSAYDVEQMRRIAKRLASGQANLEVEIVSP